MNILNDVITLIETLSNKRGHTEPYICQVIFSDPRKLDKLRSGKDMGAIRGEKAIQSLSNYWPDDLDWPSGIFRPAAKAVADRKLQHPRQKP